MTKIKSKKPVKPKNPESRDSGFPIVGLGASAGGLEAFEQFFRHAPSDSGIAFVLVSHLDPGHASILTEILQRATSMPVVEAEDQMIVAPNCVYVIPPNREMTIFHNALQLCEPKQPHGVRMPIDVFLRSLAEDQDERAIGIILSGTGTDGTLGLRAILGAGGVSLVQEPATAKFDGMPTSAIQGGYATHVLPVEKMPETLLTDLHTLDLHQEKTPAAPAATSSINRIMMLLRTATGHDFSLYKKSTIGRRIERRMTQHNIQDTEVYVHYLKENPDEVSSLFKELLINVTSFFRDPEAFTTLKQEILPQLLGDKPEDYVFRVWVAGCSTGEEAYSIAILLREFMNETHQEFKVQIYATDLANDPIAVARAGLYPPNIVQDVTSERLSRFFIKEDAGYRIKKEIREMVVFAIQNVIKDPPFTKLDLLSCRNLMIYLEPELQNRLIPAFHYALKPGGVLLLSPSEGIGSHTDLFAPISRKWKLYRAIHSIASTRAVLAEGLSCAGDSGDKMPKEVIKKAKEIDLAELTLQTLLQSYAPASVVTDLKGNILYVHGETGKYLRPAPGQATLNMIEMARDNLQLELRTAILHVASLGTPVLNRELAIKTNGDFHSVSLSVRPLANRDGRQDLLLTSFQDVTHPTPSKPRRSKRATESRELLRIEELERDLAYTKENLQATIEEQQASNEELKSTNEEMQSTNEELQSTNEELETSKEELQSVNEELITVNAELQSKIEQLAGMQNDMKNLLDNINVGTIFLDQQLYIRRFTREATRIYRLVATDIGRPLRDIKSDLEDEHLLAAAQTVLDTLVPYERELRTIDNVWFLAHIQPYRTLENMIDGVVLTFTDITERIQAIATQEARELAEGIVDTVHEPLIVLDAALKVVSASRSFYRDFQVTPEATLGHSIYDLGNRQWDTPALHKLLESILPNNQSFEGYAVEHDFPVIGHRKMRLNGSRIISKTGESQLILLTLEDVGDGPVKQ
jgi:two-component system CheB/CheR fusion protein